MAKSINDRVIPTETIQWHLNTSKFDVCPACKANNMGYLGSRHRCCLSCYRDFKIRMTQKDWLESIGE